MRLVKKLLIPEIDQRFGNLGSKIDTYTAHKDREVEVENIRKRVDHENIRNQIVDIAEVG